MRSRQRILELVSLLTIAVHAPPASAQLSPNAALPPAQMIDPNLIDLRSGGYAGSFGGLSIGDQDNPVFAPHLFRGTGATTPAGIPTSGFVETGSCSVNADPPCFNTFVAYLGDHAIPFQNSHSEGSTQVWDGPQGERLTYGYSSGYIATLTLKDGTVVHYQQNANAFDDATRYVFAFLKDYVKRDGEVVSIADTVTWDVANYNAASTRGFRQIVQAPSASQPFKVKLVNSARTLCAAISCIDTIDGFPRSSTSQTGSGSPLMITITDANQKQKTISNSWNNSTGVINFTITDAAGKITYIKYSKFGTGTSMVAAPYLVSRVENERGTTTYSYTVDTTHTSMAVITAAIATYSDGSASTLNHTVGTCTYTLTDGLNRSTVYAFTDTPQTPSLGDCTPNLLKQVTYPDGQTAVYDYDARGNNKKRTINPKPGSGLVALVWTASFDATCSDPMRCNQPNYEIDARGNQTDYTYHSPTGLVASITGPADANGVRPVRRFTYAQRYAWLKNSSSGYSQAATPIWVKTEERTCRTTATVSGACAGGSSDEVLTAYDYGPDSGPNNLFARGVAVTADGQTRRVCYGYDALGNRISETKARAGLASCP